MPSVTLNAFIQRAEATSGQTKLDVAGGAVRATGTNFLSRVFRDMTGDKAQNRNTVSAFVSAIAMERGEHAARFIGRSNLLADVLDQGKPLTSSLVRQVMKSLDGEMSGLAAFNQGKAEAFRADAGPGGMRAMIRERCAALGMPGLASGNFVDALAGRIGLEKTDGPYSDTELRTTAQAAIDRELAASRPIVENNMREYRQFTAMAGYLTDKALSKELEVPLMMDGEETKVVLNRHFDAAQLETLVEYALGQVREKAEGPDPVSFTELRDVFTSILEFKHTAPPDTLLITGMDNYALMAGLPDLNPVESREMQGLAVLYGIHSQEGLMAGLEVARELSGRLEELGNIDDPAALLGVLSDVSRKGVIPPGSGNTESLQTIVGFGFKSAMILSGSSQEAAKKIFDVLCGDAAKALETPLGTAADAAGGNPGLVFGGILGTHLALRTAVREAAGLRRADQPLDAADLRVGASSRFTDIPDALLAKMYMTGCPCGTTERRESPTLQALSRMDPESAGMIIKAFQGVAMNGVLVSLAYQDILENGKQGFSLERMFRNQTGRDLTEPRGPSFSDKMQEALLKAAMERHLPGVERTNAVTGMLVMAIPFLGLSPAKIGELYHSGQGLTLESLNAEYLPGLGNHDSLTERHGKLREQVGSDFHRRFQRTDSLTVDFGNGVSFATGPGGANLPEEYRATAHEGKLEHNLFAQRIVAEVDALCGPDIARQAAVYTLFTASAMTFGKGAGELVRREGMPPFNEHASFSVSLRKGADGTIVGTLTAPPGYPYDITAEYTIAPGGANTLTGFTMRAREEAAGPGAAQQAREPE